MGAAFGVLGPLAVHDPSAAPVPLGGRRARELLAVLLLHRGQIVSVDRLVALLWGDRPPSGAATTLRTYVGQVRRILARAGASASLDSQAGGYRLQVQRDDVDAEVFESLLRSGQEAAARDATEAARLLRQALDLWRGDVLSDLVGLDGTAAAVARWNELRLVAWEAWIDTQLALGRHRQVVTRLHALVDDHPFRERLSAQLMLALYRSGRQADALAVAAAAKLRLADELGLDPGPELRELESSMLRQSPLLDADPAAGDAVERWLAATPRAPATSPPRTEPMARLDLLERDNERAILASVIASAAAGRGAGVAISGDAGTGKSTLLQVACADGPRLRLLRGHCDPLDTPRPLGPFRDIAEDAGLDILGAGDDTPLSQACEAAYAALRSTPTVLAIEDIHWIDAASVDVLRFLARRIRGMPLALLLTYRDHEIGPRHPARALLGDLATLQPHTVVPLRPLSESGVRALVEGTGLDPHRVHELTGGNPFFVTEVVKDPSRPLPPTVRDAVLARTVGVTPEDLDVLQLVATAPDRLDERVLAALGVQLDALRRLEGTGLLARTRGGLAYRHELARQAVESTVPPGGGRRLHAKVLEALEQLGLEEPALLTHHAVAAADSGRACRYGQRAATAAVRSGAHHEAAAFLEIALAHCEHAAPQERAEILQRLSMELYMVSRLDEALSAIRSAMPLYEGLSDHAGLSAAHDRTAIFEYYNARRRPAEAHAEHAVRIAQESGSTLEQGDAFATRGFLAYLRNDLELAAACSAEATAIAHATDHSVLALRADMVGALSRFAGDDNSVRDRLTDVIARARASGWDELASTGYSQLGYCDVEHRRLRAAGQVLEESLPFAISREIPVCEHWQTGLRARVRFGLGDWDAALEDAQRVVGLGGMPLARLWSLLIMGLVPVRRGIDGDAVAAVEAAWGLSVSIDEPLRRLAVLAGLAEVMWTTGVPDERVTVDAVRDVERLAGTPGSAWAVGELATWLARLGLLRRVPVLLPEPYRHSFAGRHDEAAAWWRRNGEPFSEAMALGDSAEPGHAQRALALLDGLRAAATAARVRSSQLSAAHA